VAEPARAAVTDHSAADQARDRAGGGARPDGGHHRRSGGAHLDRGRARRRAVRRHVARGAVAARYRGRVSRRPGAGAGRRCERAVRGHRCRVRPAGASPRAGVQHRRAPGS
jgi:hypothetical protein